MQAMRSPRKPGSPWLVRSALIVIVVGLVAAGLWLLLRSAPPPAGAEPGIVELPKPRSGYENRAVWRTPASRHGGAAAPKISGTVYDAAGGPIEGAKVSATTFQVAGNQSTVVGTVETDSLGRFTMVLADGTYYLNGEKPGYGPSIAMAHSGDEVGLVLRKGGVVEGRVIDDKKQPVTRFTIDVIGPGTDDMAAPAPFLSRSFESADGSFRIAELPRQAVFLRATAPGLAPGVTAMLKVGDAKTDDVEIILSAGCVMTGMVVDADGTPLADVFLDAELRRSAGMMGVTSIDAASQADSDAAGRFKLDHVPIGDVVVRAYDGSHAVTTVELHVEKCGDPAQIEVRMAAGSTLSGVVKTADGKPIAGAKLTLSHRSTGFVDTVSAEDGKYRFEKLPAGGMRVEAQADGERVMALVMIAEGQSAEQDITLPAAGTGEIRGKVTAGGKPLSGLQLLIASNNGGGTMGMRRPVTGPDGGYRVTGLKEGLYVVIVASTNQLQQAKVEAGGTATVDLDVGLTQEPGKIPKVPTREERMAKDGDDAPSSAATATAAPEQAPTDNPPPPEDDPAPPEGEGP